MLAELLASGQPLAQALERFMARRFERCRMVVESSCQLGEWEKTPELPGADPTALIARAMRMLAAPI